MRFEDGLPQTQIAQAVGLSQMHVSRLIRKSLSEMREELLPGLRTTSAEQDRPARDEREHGLIDDQTEQPCIALRTGFPWAGSVQEARSCWVHCRP